MHHFDVPRSEAVLGVNNPSVIGADREFEIAASLIEHEREVLLETYQHQETRQTQLLRQLEAATGEPYPFEPESPVSLVGGPGNDLIYVILESLKQRGVAKGETGERLSAFFSSKHFQEMPINKTSTRLFALIAHDAANHQKHPPDEGTANDIDLVSAYLPCAGLWVAPNWVFAEKPQLFTTGERSP